MPEALPRVSGFHDVLVPERELVRDDNHWFFYSAEQTGSLALLNLHNRSSGAVVSTMLANPEKRVASHKAWAAARHSRAPGTVLQILMEMAEKGVDPDKKLEYTFKTYGHASVADLADGLIVHFFNVPMMTPLMQFNQEETYSAQEKSTRFQPEFSDAPLASIDHFLLGLPENDRVWVTSEYQRLGKLAMELYRQNRDETRPVLELYYQAGSDKKRQDALTARNLDAVRGFLPFGIITGHALETSAREWSSLIAKMKGSHILSEQNLGVQLETLLAPGPEIEGELGFRAEAPSLIRHTEAATTVNKNLDRLKHFFESETDLLTRVDIEKSFRGPARQSVTLIDRFYSVGDKMVAQYLLSIWPGLHVQSLLDYVHYLGQKDRVSEIIFNGHSNYNEMPNMAGTSELMLRFQAQTKVLRDLNRHRAWERFLTLPLAYGGRWSYDTARQVLAKGFSVSVNLTEVPELERQGIRIEQSLSSYYHELTAFLEKAHQKFGESLDYTFVCQLLPLAHMAEIYMSGDPKQAVYMTYQRVRPGGDFDYRNLAYLANNLIANSDGYLIRMSLQDGPNPSNRQEFFDRS